MILRESKIHRNQLVKNSILKNYFKTIIGIFVFIFILLFDHFSKLWILRNYQTKPLHIMPYFDFIFVQNRGVAFGLLSNSSLNFTLISLLSIGLILFLLKKFLKTPSPILIAMILAGALGNIWDRIQFGYVIDFVKVGSFYVFNAADSSITLSAIWILIMILYENRKTV